MVNVGDLVHPVPAIPDLYAAAAARFHEQVKELKHPLYLTPGNHDVGDKPNDWAPAARIHEDYLALWDEHFGAQYQSFDHNGCHFIIINAQIVNSGFAAEEEATGLVGSRPGGDRGQANIPALATIRPISRNPTRKRTTTISVSRAAHGCSDLLDQYGVEALFIGHVHNFWFYRHAKTDCYLLPSTAFVRLDYSEMYRISPGPDSEFGRNDKDRNWGILSSRCTKAGTSATSSAPMAPRPRWARRTRRGRRASPPPIRASTSAVDFGFDMRHNWMEIVEIPPTGGLDEFDRKEVRNDYPLMALWEMGVKKVRVPLRDLLVADNIDRMRTLKAHGHEFTLFSFGDPAPHHRGLISGTPGTFFWPGRFASTGRSWSGTSAASARWRGPSRCPFTCRGSAPSTEQRSEAGKYYHAINHGFLADDQGQMAEVLARPEISGALNGFVFRLTLGMSPWATAATASKIAADLGVAASLHLRMCGPNPALEAADDQLSVIRIAEAMAAAAAFDNVTVYADTFVDIDRGYFPRTGVLDRSVQSTPRISCGAAYERRFEHGGR